MKKIYLVLIFILFVVLLPCMKSFNTTEMKTMADVKKADSIFNIVGIKGYTVSPAETDKAGQIYYTQERTSGGKRKKRTTESHRYGVYKYTLTDGYFYTFSDTAKFSDKEYVILIEQFSDYNTSTKTTGSRPETVTDDDYIIHTGSNIKIILFNMLINGFIFALISFVVYALGDSKKK